MDSASLNWYDVLTPSLPPGDQDPSFWMSLKTWHTENLTTQATISTSIQKPYVSQPSGPVRGREAVARAAAQFRRSKRPIILAGGGIHLSGAYEALLKFAEDLASRLPDIEWKGCHSLYTPAECGLFGRWSRIANDLIETSDCILAVGCKMGEIATKRYALMPRGVPFIHLDIVAEEIGRTTPTEVALWGDAAEGLLDLHASLADDTETLQAQHAAYIAEIAERMAAWRVEAEPRYASEERPIHMARLVRELQGVMPDDGILVVDGGFAAHWTGLLYDSTRAGRSYIANRGFASIGYGLPGTIGAQLAAPDSPVIGLTGDAGFNMMLGELETARRLELGFTLAIVNNAASGYVKALQHSLYGGRYQSSDLSETHYANVARELGCHGIRVSEPSKLGAAFAEGIAARDIPTIIDVIVTRDPAKMLPGVDSRTAPVQKGDRPA